MYHPFVFIAIMKELNTVKQNQCMLQQQLTAQVSTYLVTCRAII
jgi:hypothetical protein